MSARTQEQAAQRAIEFLEEKGVEVRFIRHVYPPNFPKRYYWVVEVVDKLPSGMVTRDPDSIKIFVNPESGQAYEDPDYSVGTDNDRLRFDNEEET